MRERTRAPRRLGRSLAVISVLTTLAIGGTASPSLADSKPAGTSTTAATTAGVPGDLTGDGAPSVLTQAINLTVRPSHGAPFTAAAPEQSPEGLNWTQYQSSSRGSLTGSKTDDLYVFAPASHTLYAYPNDANFGGTPGHFTHKDKAAKVAKPATCAPGSDCTGYDPTWNTATQVLATNGIDNADGLPDLLTVENGKLWYYPGKTGTLLGSPVLLGTGNWTDATLIAPGKVAGTPTLLVRSTDSGALTGYQLGFKADGTPNALLTAPAPTLIQSGVLNNAGNRICLLANGNPVRALDCNAYPDHWQLGTDGTLRTYGECLTEVPALQHPMLAACDGRAAEKWTVGPGGTLVDSDGQCLTASDNIANPWYRTVPLACTGAANQTWGSFDPKQPTPGAPLVAQPVLAVNTPSDYGFTGISSPGDLDGDGNPDLLVNEFQATTGALVYEYPGAPAVNGAAQFGSPVSLGGLATPGSTLQYSNRLNSGQVLYSACAGLAMQADGDLVLTSWKTGKTLWSSGTAGHPGSYAQLDSGSNLVVYDQYGTQKFWSSGTANYSMSAGSLTLGDDCNAIVRTPDNVPIWSTRTYDPAYDTTGHPIMSGTVLHGGDVLTAGHTTLTMGTDGNLVLADQSTGHILWTSGTPGHPGATAVMQPDGNLVVYAPQGWPMWAPGTNGYAGGHAIVQNDGNFVLYSADGLPAWTTDTWYGGVTSRGYSIAEGTVLRAGDSVQSKAGHLDMQPDGNLVLYSKVTGRALWSTNTWGRPGATATMQTDGNFVLYGPDGRALWASGTPGQRGANLVLQDDDNLVLYVGGKAPWASHTENTVPVWLGTSVRAPAVMHAGDTVYNAIQYFPSHLIMQADGNLVLYSTATGGRAIWSSNTWGHPGATAVMQADGNFVVYAAEGWPMWSSNTWGHPGTSLVVQNDDNLVLYDADAHPIWASNTNGQY
ncbi:ricin-type beta-trefoil lectin domain protein [Kitasatospora azatica]|uniref:ricin-type beta-trefoil lectin domain protein n=1 Tax=Kitasatospora azatica TaxID=58347 RepID=UPI00068CD042|nr:ricin-type beta-trefoil lectin domain protein [Kitasatospora azatica]